MLLRALYDFARRENLFESVHLQDRKIHMLIPISGDGELLGEEAIPLYEPDGRGKERLGRSLKMPRFPGENNGGKAYFLAESCIAMLGVEKESGSGLPVEGERLNNPAKSFLHFWERINKAHEATHLPQLNALLRFRKRYLTVDGGKVNAMLPFLEVRSGKSGKKELGAKTTDGGWERLAKATLSFQVNGNLIFDASPDHPITEYWSGAYRREAFTDDGESATEEVALADAFCMVTAKAGVRIARSHKPKLLRIPNIGSGGYLVSFARECPAFSSYGFDMGENAPISEEAASSYVLALQSLLDSDANSLRIGPMVVCFWARESPDASGFFARMLNKPDPKSVADFISSPWSGIDRQLAKQDSFFSITLSGNAGRVVVRHWMQKTVEEAIENIRRWFEDLKIVEIRGPTEKSGIRKRKTKGNDVLKKEDVPPLAVFRLACATVRDAKDLQPDVPYQLYRAAMDGTSPPLLLVKPILHRLEADLQRYGAKTLLNMSRFALLRLILNRNGKDGAPMIQPHVFDTDDPAYNCGRLLAILAETQAKAHEYKLEGPGMAERYFGAASVSPSSVFPLLLRLNRHHLDKIRKSDRFRSHAPFLEKGIQGIMSRFHPTAPEGPPQFPRILDLHAQGRFAIGFYQQKADADARRNPVQSDDCGEQSDRDVEGR